jgi:GAF domain-containing protein
MNRESILLSTLMEITEKLVNDYDVIDVLTALSHRCVEAVGVDGAGVMLISSTSQPELIASSSEPIATLELFQIASNEGPSVDCIRNGRLITNEALSKTDDRWPMFAPRAIIQGFRAVHSLPMRLRGRTIGSLSLFRTTQGALAGADMVVARYLADVATISILQHHSTGDASTSDTQLRHAINSRVIIEQAVGMIRQATSCDKDVAFDRLQVLAGNRHEDLTVVATQIVGKVNSLNDLDAWVKQQDRGETVVANKVDRKVGVVKETAAKAQHAAKK